MVYFSGVFSESTYHALQFHSKTCPDFLPTSRFVKFVLDIWKIMSLKTPSKGKLFVKCLYLICIHLASG